jgi:ribosomal protein S6
MEYELLYLVGESKDGELPKIREDVEAIVREVGGTFLPAETEEKRNLAYEIKKERRGTYVARRFTLPLQSDEPFVEPTEPKENAIDAITRKLKLYPGVLRMFILRADKLPELKAIPREERPKPVRRDSRRPSSVPDRRPTKPVTGEEWKAEEPVKKEEVVPVAKAEESKEKEKAPEKKPLSAEEMDKQLKEVLDI